MRDDILIAMKYLINLYSVFVARSFETLYNSSNLSDHAKAQDRLEHYRNVRRMLPKLADGNHMGNNHSFVVDLENKKISRWATSFNAYHATQGFK